jgi:predicted SAM-dependent methyltransferase
MNHLIRINIGCGQRPTAGWENLDNSFSLRLARWPLLVAILKPTGLLRREQIENIEFNQEHDIRLCDARKRLPFADETVDVVYSSHMVEHFDQEEAVLFLREARRILVDGGLIRLALPDLRWHLSRYEASGDADRFLEGTKLGRRLPKTLLERAKAFFFGEREYHVWMYDEGSAKRLLERNGFIDVVSLPAGQTRIENPGALNLAERAPESLFVEGRRFSGNSQ